MIQKRDPARSLWRPFRGTIVPLVTKNPVTAVLVGVFWLAGIISAAIDFGPPRSLSSGIVVTSQSLPDHWWVLLSSGFWGRNLPEYLLGTLLLVFAGGFAERRLGGVRFMAAFLSCQVVGIAVALGASYAIAILMGSWSAQLRAHTYVGPTAMIFGALMAATAALGALWRRRIRLTVMVLLILLVLFSGSFADVVRLCAATAGLVLGPLLQGRGINPRITAASRHESRVLVALVVAASAIGPVLAGVLPHAVGPLAVLRFLFTNIQPVDPQTLHALCSDPSQVKDCATATLQQRAGAGGIFMAILPSVLLLLLADGLRRGRRFAWATTLLIETGLAVVAGTYIVAALFPRGANGAVNEGLGSLDVAAFRHPLSLVLPLLLPILLVILLVLTRRFFPVKAPPKTYFRLAGMLAAIGAGLAVIYVAAGLLLARDFTPTPGLLTLTADVLDRFLAVGFLVDQSAAFFPQSTLAVLLYEGIGVLFWGAAAVLVLRTFLLPANTGRGTDQQHARNILTRTGGSSLSWMTTWAGNSYWFSASGNSFIAYRVHAGVALALGPPVGPPRDLATNVLEFTCFTAANGWTPAFYSVGQQVVDVTQAQGWGSIQVAQDTILDLNGMAFSGKEFQDIRTSLNKAAREGICAEWVSYPSAPLSVLDQIHAISEEWIADKRMPEMGFTLGGIDEVNDAAVRCLLAIDAQHTVHAVASWLPVYRDGVVVGWTLDFMRRRGSGFRSGIEFLIASAALSFRDQGYEYISLSGAPLAQVGLNASPNADPAPDALGMLDWLLDRIGAILEPVYGFRSLLAFKSKFQPRYEPLFMVYPEAAALPKTANAITKAYLPKVSLGQGLSLVRRLIWRSAKPLPVHR